MQRYKRTYLDFFGYVEQDFIPCEVCGSMAVDVHHIVPKGRGKIDESIDNLIAVCREHHNTAHEIKISIEELIKIHKRFILWKSEY